jgi:hypothetical protein
MRLKIRDGIGVALPNQSRLVSEVGRDEFILVVSEVGVIPNRVDE